MRALYLVRHGETAWNAERRLQGREDLPLSVHGREQVESLRPVVTSVLPEIDRLAVVTSPLRRARETQDVLGLSADTVDARWQEADLGTWTGRSRDDLVAVGDGAYAAWRAGTHTPPGAESIERLRARVAAAIDDLAHLDTVLVLTHGGPIRAACHLLVGLVSARLVPVQPGSLTAFDLTGPTPRLRAYNLTPSPAVGELVAEPPD